MTMKSLNQGMLIKRCGRAMVFFLLCLQAGTVGIAAAEFDRDREAGTWSCPVNTGPPSRLVVVRLAAA
jgi:hypothetical protein